MRSTFRVGMRAAILGSWSLVLCGCGDWATVQGEVKLDSRPLDAGNVIFHPSGEGATAYGTVSAAGKYELKTGDRVGLKPGSYVVTVVKSTIPEMTSPNPVVKVLTPAKYADKATSDLKVTVQSGQNTIPLELKTK